MGVQHSLRSVRTRQVLGKDPKIHSLLVGIRVPARPPVLLQLSAHRGRPSSAMHEAACHRVLRAHLRGFHANTRHGSLQQQPSLQESLTPSAPPPPPPPAAADHLTLRSVHNADSAPFFLHLLSSNHKQAPEFPTIRMRTHRHSGTDS